jgi:RHS repeat-associated protein
MKRIVFSLLLALQLYADPKDPYVLAVTEGEPATLIGGVVSAITGDLYFAEEDVVVQGYVPLHLPRYYVSGNGEGSRAGWSFISHLNATLKPLDANQIAITVQDPNGSTFVFRGPRQEVTSKYEDKVYTKKKHVEDTRFNPPAPAATPGLTNTGQGEISGRTNLKNAYIKLEADGRHFSLVCPDGTVRYYKGHHKQKNYNDVFRADSDKHLDYLLEWEKFPAGHMIQYKYDDYDRVYDIRTTNPEGTRTYAAATVHHLHKDPHKDAGSDIYTSDGRTLCYRFEAVKGKHHTNFILRGVIPPDAPIESLIYQDSHKYCGPLVCQRVIPGGRAMNFDYYRPGNNYVDSATLIKIKDHHDPRCLRVKGIGAPVGSDGTPHLTHRFFHYPELGYTDVLEIDNAYTRYEYKLDTRRLYCIYRYDASRNFINSEYFSWNSYGEITGRAFYDAKGVPFLTRGFEYDSFGNVANEKFYGNLSGLSPSEVAVTKRQYSQDGRNLLLREEDPSGKITAYSYHGNTSLISSKLIYEGSQIKRRQFYEYNHELILFKEILDDGSTADRNNLTGVHTRRIKLITPMPNEPYYGMPYIIEERYGNGSSEVRLKKTVLTYTKGGLVSEQKVYDANDVHRYTLTTEYDGLGRPIKETNALGQTATYAYDEVGNRIVSQDFSGKTAYMTYDYSNRLTSVKEVGPDKLERTTRHGYDGKHNRTATIDHFGNTTQFAYDNFGHAIRTHLPQLLDSKGSTVNPVIYSAYDGAGREISRTDVKGENTQTQYNARSQKAVVQHPDGTQEKFVYNIDGTVKAHTDQEGHVRSYVYDVFGRKTSEKDPLGRLTTYVYDGFNLISVTDPEGNKTAYSYDGAGRKIAEEKNGEKIQYGYDTLGRLAFVQTVDLITFTDYDLLDRKVEERKEDLKGNLLFKEKYAYDNAGNIKAITRFIAGQEAQETFIYDSFGRLISNTDALGHQTTIHYNENLVNGLKQRVLQKTTTDPLGLQTIETYDAYGRVVLTEIKNVKGAICSREQKFYDANGNLTTQVSTIFPTGKTITTVWEYGLLNRLKSLTEAFGTPEAKTTQYTYTKRGLLSQTIKPDGIILERNYDACRNLISLTSSNRSIAYAYRYNALGQLIESQDLNTNLFTRRTLDPKGRILEEALANGLVLASDYDDRGRRIELVLPDRSSIAYDRDPLHLRKVMRKDAQGFTLYTHLYKEYDLAGNLLSSDLIGNLGVIDFNIDPLGRTSGVRSPYFSQEILSSDAVGNITELQTLNEQATFTYDDLYQVIEETGRFAHRYQFDSHNNRLQKDTQRYEHNALHQFVDHTYDRNGNPKTYRDARLFYDALDRLISIQAPQLRIDLTYDSFHRRLTKTVAVLQGNIWQETERLFFIYDDLNEIGATDASGRIVQLRVLGQTPRAEIGAAVALELNDKPYAVISDLIGNTACLIAPEDQSSQTYLYGAFGDTAALNTSVQSPWQFASKRLDAETGLIFYGRRYYDPIFGRWLTPDPKGFVDGMNLYAFVLNNPVNEIDLYGLTVNNEVRWLNGNKPVVPMAFVLPAVVKTKQLASDPKTPPRIPGPLDKDFGVRQLYNEDGTPKKEHPYIRFELGVGIGNTAEDNYRNAQYISKLLGKLNVHYVENLTQGIFSDLGRFFETKRGHLIPPNVYQLAQEWMMHDSKGSSQQMILRFCQSEGVLQTKVALSLVPQEIRNKIHIVAIAPSVCIPEDMCGSVLHLYSEKDVIPQFFALKEAEAWDQMHNFKKLKSNAKFTVLEHGIKDPVYKNDLMAIIKERVSSYDE